MRAPRRVRAFGSLPAVKAEVRHIDRQTARHVRWTTWLADLRQDVVAGLRQFRKAPGFTAAAVLTIALGIGATTAIFGVVHAVVLRPLPFAEPDRDLRWSPSSGAISAATSRCGNFVDWRAASTDVVRRTWRPSTTAQPERRRRRGARARARPARSRAAFFELFGMAPLHGRVLRADEDSPGRDGVVVLSHGFFVQRFGGRSGGGRTHHPPQRPPARRRRRDAGSLRLPGSTTARRGCPTAFTPEQRGRARRALPHRLRPAGSRASRWRRRRRSAGRGGPAISRNGFPRTTPESALA